MRNAIIVFNNVNKNKGNVLNNVCRIVAIVAPPILKASLGMPSGPAAFLFLRFFSAFRISFSRYVVQNLLGLSGVQGGGSISFHCFSRIIVTFCFKKILKIVESCIERSLLHCG